MEINLSLTLDEIITIKEALYDQTEKQQKLLNKNFSAVPHKNYTRKQIEKAEKLLAKLGEYGYGMF